MESDARVNKPRANKQGRTYNNIGRRRVLLYNRRVMRGTQIMRTAHYRTGRIAFSHSH